MFNFVRKSTKLREIKHTLCKECQNRKGCELKYSGIYIHEDVPEVCLLDGNYKKERITK